LIFLTHTTTVLNTGESVSNTTVLIHYMYIQLMIAWLHYTQFCITIIYLYYYTTDVIFSVINSKYFILFTVQITIATRIFFFFNVSSNNGVYNASGVDFSVQFFYVLYRLQFSFGKIF
jgi:hypothetical protein